MADGARWSNADGVVPDTNMGWDNSGSSPGAQYADYGPWSSFTRTYVPGSGLVYSMRHGVRMRTTNVGSYRLNAAFFDGHVDTLDGNAAMNPSLWMPKGTSLPASECSTAAKNLYFNGASTLDVE